MDPSKDKPSGVRKLSARNQVRDPVEHALWVQFYPIIAEWEHRPYFKEPSIHLNLAAAERLYAPEIPERKAEHLLRWRAAQAHFMAVIEYRSVGAIGNKLEELGDVEGAARMRNLGASLAPRIEAARRKEEHMRADLKQLLEAGGLSTLLNDERYVPPKYGEDFGEEPVVFSIGQTSIIGVASVRVKNLFDPPDDLEGLRIVCDMYPPQLTSRNEYRYAIRLYDGLPSRRLFDWFGHIPERWAEFQHYHHRQLHADHRGMVKMLQLLSKGPTTLLHLKRGEYSIAQSLCNYLLSHYPHVFATK